MSDETRTKTVTESPGAGLFDKLAGAAGLKLQEDQLPATREVVGDFAVRLQDFLADAGKSGTIPKRPHAVLSALLQAVDDRLSAQVNEIIHHETFKQAESTWRGLNFLIKGTKPDPMIKFKVLDASKEALLEDFESATQEDLSSLFQKVYEQNYGIYGGQPIGLMVGDYEFTPETQDIALLTSLSRLAAASHAPFLAAAGPEMFGWSDFTRLEGKGSLRPIFDTHINPQYAPWDAFRKSDDSRYAALCMPHILLREPYKKRTRAFQFEEEVDGTDLKSFLWGNASHALATRITDAFHKHRWCVSIRGPEGGGLVEGLPTYTFPTDRGDVGQTCPTEIAITQRAGRELSELGFVPLEHRQASNMAAFFSTPTCQEPKIWNTDEATANSALSARLQYIMATSRFAHYLQVMMRNKVGAYMSRPECQHFLYEWIRGYVTTDPYASPSQKAEYPLSDASIEVIDDPRRPGCYKAKVLLRPHFQLEALNVSLGLVAELPQQPTSR